MKDPTGTLAPILVVTDVARAVETYVQVFGFGRLNYFDGNDDYVPLGRDEVAAARHGGRERQPEPPARRRTWPTCSCG